MGGKIRVVSYPGKGSTFYFTHRVPKSYIEKITKKEVKQTRSDRDWTGKTILIAEDVEQNYKVIEYILNNTRATIIWKTDGRQAVNYISDGNPVDVILMDIRMPVLDGIEATKQILKLQKIPIIAQTAYTMGVEKESALAAGCIGYLSKPINAAELLKAIDNVFSDASITD